MNILVTAGNTQAPIDQVRCLTNVFTGRTGAAIALEAHRRGHHVTLLTSHPEAALEMDGGLPVEDERWRQLKYRTFEDLRTLMEKQVTGGGFNAVIHCAAVSDYLAAGVFAPAEGTQFDDAYRAWLGTPPILVDRAAGKVKSDEPELWLRLTRAPKVVDLIRGPWGFKGVLVKFKLEVGIDEQTLLDIAEKSRQHSGADLMVANTLEGAAHWAYVGPLATGYERIPRRALPATLLAAIESKLQR